MNCFFYKILDRSKQTWIVSQLCYYGKRFKHIGPAEVSGTVSACQHPGLDGDRTFDLLDGWKRWHCEVTVCQPKSLQEKVAKLQVGDKVIVRGIETYDPNHHILWIKFNGGGYEIHPVYDIETDTNVVLESSGIQIHNTNKETK